jgi:CPA1 family monovalent cation:H+ antiporter
MPFELVFVALFSIATAVALLARWLKVPYTVALVAAGLACGTMRLIEPPHLTKELLYAVFLPGLIFEAAFHLDGRKLWQNKLAILSLAVPGVVVAIVATALVLQPLSHLLHLAPGFSFPYALVFAALLAATDPIAVLALFRRLGVPERLAILVEAESLLNDGTAVVFFTLILGMVQGGNRSLAHAGLDFIRVVGLGTAVGMAAGFLTSQLTRRVDDPMIEITLTTITAYGSFVIAEYLHLSGIIATVAAGLLFGSQGLGAGCRATTRVALSSFWEYAAFALNSIVFLLIGFEVRLSRLLADWRAILVAYLAVTAGRLVLVSLVWLLLRRSREAMPWSYAGLLTWGGLRGALSMVLALGLPAGFPFREQLLAMTFGVVLLSILAQGLTMGPVLRRLGLAQTAAPPAGHGA